MNASSPFRRVQVKAVTSRLFLLIQSVTNNAAVFYFKVYFQSLLKLMLFPSSSPYAAGAVSHLTTFVRVDARPQRRNGKRNGGFAGFSGCIAAFGCAKWKGSGGTQGDVLLSLSNLRRRHFQQEKGSLFDSLFRSPFRSRSVRSSVRRSAPMFGPFVYARLPELIFFLT